jgi:hypothetical protein
MSCAEHETTLGDYVDGTLQRSAEPADMAALHAVEAHLAVCRRCQALVDDLRTIRAAAGALEPHTPPPQLWTRIAAATETRQRGGWWRGWTGASRAWPWATVSAALLVAVSALVWTTWRQPAGEPFAGVPTEASPGAGEADVAPADPGMQLAEQQYAEAIAGLEELAAADRDALDGDTADVLQASLTVIDDAIGESRAALETEPESELAQASLFDALRMKVALLQDTVALINEMRKGNQEGAARIVTELNQ